MRRQDRFKVIAEQNKKLNAKKSSIQENYMPGEGSARQFYDFILQGEFATDEDAMEHAQGQDWGSMELTDYTFKDLDYIDTINGVEIYKNYGADYYAFAPAENEMEEGLGEHEESISRENRGTPTPGRHPKYPMFSGEEGYSEELMAQMQADDDAMRRMRYENKKLKSLKVLNEASQTMFEKLCGVKLNEGIFDRSERVYFPDRKHYKHFKAISLEQYKQLLASVPVESFNCKWEEDADEDGLSAYKSLKLDYEHDDFTIKYSNSSYRGQLHVDIYNPDIEDSIFIEVTREMLDHTTEVCEAVLQEEMDNYDGSTGDPWKDNGMSWRDFI